MCSFLSKKSGLVSGAIVLVTGTDSPVSIASLTARTKMGEGESLGPAISLQSLLPTYCTAGNQDRIAEHLAAGTGNLDDVSRHQVH